MLEATGSAQQVLPNSRFMDGTSVLIYQLDIPENISKATLGIDMWNNFVVAISADAGATFTEVLNSYKMFGHDEHNGANRDVYNVDLGPFLANNPDHSIQVRTVSSFISSSVGLVAPCNQPNKLLGPGRPCLTKAAP